MALPEDTCLALEIDLEALLGLSVTLPGGVTLQAKLQPGEFPSLQGIVQSVLEPLNAALTPLMPFFNLLDLVLALVEFAKAVPASLGPPPDPTALVDALAKLAKASAKVAGLVPFLSVPIMVVGICKLIVTALLGLIESLENIISVQASLELKRDRVALLAQNPLLLQGAAALEASIDCAQVDLDLQLSVSAGGLGPLNKFLDLLNALAGLAGLPEFAKIEAGGDAQGMLDPLRAAVEALNTVCASIPV